MHGIGVHGFEGHAAEVSTTVVKDHSHEGGISKSIAQGLVVKYLVVDDG